MLEEPRAGEVVAIDAASDAVISIAQDTFAKERQLIVFVNTKRGAESQAEKIAAKQQTSEQLRLLSEQALKALSTPTKQCKRLARCLEKGIAFHHAGLHSKQRELIEEGFRNKIVKAICATPTLAAGVDLPAFRVIIRDLKRYGGPWGMSPIPVLEYEQMCLPGKTRIHTNKGLVPIKHICESATAWKVLTYDEKTKKFSHQKVLKKHSRQAQDHIFIKTTYGYTISGTHNHPIRVRRGEKDFWLPFCEVRQGDKVMITSKTHEYDAVPLFFDFIPLEKSYLPNPGWLIHGFKRKTGLSDKKVGELINVEKKNVYHYKYDKKALPLHKAFTLARKADSIDLLYQRIREIKTAYGKKLSFPKHVEEDFLWLVGLIASDGTMTRIRDKRNGSEYTTIKITNMNKKIIAKAASIFKKYFGKNPYIGLRGDNTYSVEQGSTLLAHILSEHFGIPHNKKSAIVQVPSFLFNAHKRLIGAYLAGVFDGDGSYDKKSGRVLFATGSKKFAEQLQQLLLRLGIISRINLFAGGKVFRIKGEKVIFRHPSYTVVFQKVYYRRLFSEVAPVLKANIRTDCSTYNNIHNHHDKNYYHEWSEIAFIKKKKQSTTVYNLSVDKNNNYFANNFLVHNCGRAGRPGKDPWGEAICVAKSEDEAEKITQEYLRGEPEEIYSKLAVEPVLRTYVLSLVASDFIKDTKELYAFFDKTFYAHQYGDTAKLRGILDAMILQLQEWEFLKETVAMQDDFVSASTINTEQETLLEATILGKRVSELYLDPYTAYHVIKGLRRSTSKYPKPFAFVHLCASTLELRPYVKVRQADMDIIDEKLELESRDLLHLAPSQYTEEYDTYLDTIKTAMLMESWMEEADEESLLESYGVRPGELHGKLELMDWLVYAASELAKIMSFHEQRRQLLHLRVRLKHGAKEELLPLLKLREVGRVRARKLFQNNIKDVTGLQRADATSLAQLVGKATAIKLKEQVGQKISPESIQVKPNKRKGQKALADWG